MMARSPSFTRNVPVRSKPKPRFDKYLFAGLEIELGNPVGFVLNPGEIYMGPLVPPARQKVYMLRGTYQFIANDHDAITLVQQEWAVGVQSKMIDVRGLPSWKDADIVDRTASGQERSSLEQFVVQVSNLFVDIQGFDVEQMTDEIRAEFFTRYILLRDHAVTYRRLVAQMDGVFEVLQQKIMEIV